MKIIIFGCGKIGETIIESLVGEGHDIMAIDKDEAIVQEVTNIYDVMGLCGNGVDSDTFNEAGTKDTDLFISVTGSDELNMLSCFLARRIGAKHTIARIRNPEYNDKSLIFMKNQLDLSMALNPDLLAAHEIFNLLRFPSATSVETFSARNLEIVDMYIKEGSPLAGMKLSDLRKKQDASFLICNVVREDEIYIPDGNFELKVGDNIGITAAHAEMQKLLKNLGLSQRQPKNVMIIGASRSAYYLAKALINMGVSVKIVEKDIQRCHEFANFLPDAVVINGDGMNREVVLEEGIASTDAFIALTGNDEENILSSFAALNKNVATVITKVNKPSLAETAEKLGLKTIISPQKLVSDVISRYVRALNNSIGSNMETLYKLKDGKAEVLEFKVRPDFEYNNIKLRDMNLKDNILIAGIVRGRKPIIPTGEDVILANDKVIVLAAGKQLVNLSDIVAK